MIFVSKERLKLAIASDHGGLRLKNRILDYLLEQGYPVDDLGCNTTESVDYPDYAEKLAVQIARGKYQLGILICGSGIGVAISANKMPGVRAALCHDSYSARMARKHNDANVLTMGERVIGEGLALSVVDGFLEATFDGGRHEGRVNKIKQIETKHLTRREEE